MSSFSSPFPVLFAMRHAFSTGLLVLAALLTAPAAQAQNALQDEPGFVSPRLVENWFDARADTEVNLDGPLLKIVAEGMRSEEPDVASLLGKLKGVYVRRYASSAGLRPDAVASRMAELMDRLEAEGWQTVVRNREGGELVNVFLKTRGDEAISGLVVLKTEPGVEDGESVFVNIVGDVSPQEIGALTGSIDGLDSLGNLGGGSLGDDGSQ